MTREDAERICQAHGWELAQWFPTARHTEVRIPTTAYGGTKSYEVLSPEVLRALDPDRPPPLAALKRIRKGLNRMMEDTEKFEKYPYPLTLEVLTEWANGADLLNIAWNFGRDER
jgi:hypothetical protein